MGKKKCLLSRNPTYIIRYFHVGTYVESHVKILFVSSFHGSIKIQR